ncbi:cytochrome P450 [Paenibacillus baekrokdamisoli]|uniref:Cytochrome P450 n=1 Tax=Paenibacillus baekrokdamisoli TaxID=1712516 RepID=A0A3G9JLM8_9BACL|nr:cytochrome P450 [Paenibacillus baekrokdamisoli]MBB3068982.1 cytochrome P450 [Paenibacillus baekrokdamisoli]BBH23804.1 cytochrome P450 [Paenibacillus baekrokdamisoli]
MSRIVGIPSSRVANFLRFQRDPLGFLVDALPLGDVISLRTSSFRPTYVINSPEFIQEILVRQDDYFQKGRSSGVLRRTIGDGLLTSEHETHHRQKRYLTPVFYKERIQAYSQIVVEETLRCADQLENGVAIPMHDRMMQLTLSIIARSMFNTNLDADKAELAAAVDMTIRHSAKSIFSPIIIPFSVPTRGNMAHKRAIRTLETMIYDAIAAAKREPDRYADSLLGLLLDTKDEAGEPITDVEIRDQMMTMLLAGHETTANALVWTWYLLERGPEVEDRLHEELDAMRLKERQTGGRLGPFERYRELTYTKQIVQETLRLYPPAWAILREAERDVELLGQRFVANSSFIISPYAIHRNDEVFGDAAAFRPERFDAGLTEWPRFAYFPFGGGARGCIGSQFAMMEAALIVSTLAERFSFISVEGQGEAVPEPLVSLRIKKGRWMIPRRR